MDIPPMPPVNPLSAPQIITLPPDLNLKLGELWAKSLEEKKGYGGKYTLEEHEMAATLVRDKTRTLLITNVHVGSSGSSEPDRAVSPGQEVVGTIHTHPYASGATGSFDAADTADLLRSRNLVKIVLSGNHQFILMRTAETRGTISASQKASFDRAKEKLLKLPGIANSRDPMLKNSQAETEALAYMFKLAYYEGQDGTLKRVLPR